MNMEETMQKLHNASGEQFDQELVSAMIEHHTSGIEMAKMAQEKTMDEELREMASEIVDKQEREVERLKEMQKEMAF